EDEADRGVVADRAVGVRRDRGGDDRGGDQQQVDQQDLGEERSTAHHRPNRPYRGAPLTRLGVPYPVLPPFRSHRDATGGTPMTTTKSSNWAAGIRTTLLLAGLTGLLVVIGALIGGPQTALLFLGIGLVMNLGVYWFSDKIALKSAGAKP